MRRKFALMVVGIIAIASVVFADAIQPVAMNHKAIGGAAIAGTPTQGVQNGKGVNNIGLLVKTWGKVTYKDAGGAFFYFDDGSGIKDGTKDAQNNELVGIRVAVDSLASGNSISLTNLVPGQTSVTVIGVISTFADASGKIHPKLRPRNQADVIVAKP